MNNELSFEEKNILLDHIRDIPDFPKPDIVFKDITPLLGSPKALNILMDHLANRYLGMELDFIAGIDARGFIFGSILADRLGVGFVPIRKKGKLPYTTVAQKYSLEYGYDEVEIHIDAFGKDGAKVVLIDDLIATGGTARAACELIEKVGAKCVECCFVVELEFLNGKEKFEDQEIYSVIKF